MDFRQSVEKELRRGRSKATWWAFAVLVIGAIVFEASGVPSILAIILSGILAVIIFFVLLQGSFKVENLERDAGTGDSPPVIPATSRIVATGAAKGDVAQELAGAAVSTFSAAKFGRVFAGRAFDEGWPLEKAMNTWYAMAHVALAQSVSALYSGGQDASGVLAACERYMRDGWGMSENEYAEFRAAIEQNEPEALAALGRCESGGDLLQFASRLADRILGVRVSFSVGGKDFPLMDYLSNGLEPKAGAQLAHAVFQVFYELQESSARILKTIQH
jgi:hypothetical protein